MKSLRIISSKGQFLFLETLGFMEDKRDLKKLESLVTHQKCNHAKELCQYEIEKAIRKIKGDYYVLFGFIYIEKDKKAK